MVGPTYGEVWIVCEECGARLWSEDGFRGVKGIRCPYKKDSRGRCRTPDEAPELY